MPRMQSGGLPVNVRKYEAVGRGVGEASGRMEGLKKGREGKREEEGR